MTLWVKKIQSGVSMVATMGKGYWSGRSLKGAGK